MASPTALAPAASCDAASDAPACRAIRLEPRTGATQGQSPELSRTARPRRSATAPVKPATPDAATLLGPHAPVLRSPTPGRPGSGPSTSLAARRVATRIRCRVIHTCGQGLWTTHRGGVRRGDGRGAPVGLPCVARAAQRGARRGLEAPGSQRPARDARSTTLVPRGPQPAGQGAHRGPLPALVDRRGQRRGPASSTRCPGLEVGTDRAGGRRPERDPAAGIDRRADRRQRPGTGGRRPARPGPSPRGR